MKKVLTAVLSVVLLTTLTIPGLAAREVGLYFDGKQVRTELMKWTDSFSREDVPDIFYMDVSPQIASGRVFVPIRIVSAFFGAEVEWKSPHIYLTLGDTTLTLTINSDTVLINDTQMTLEAAPYIKDGRTMVPLRFISEAFGYEVGFRAGNVYIYTPSLYIDGLRAVSAQHYQKMTHGGILNESETNICINLLYQFLLDSIGEEITMSEYFGDEFDTQESSKLIQFIIGEIFFMETEGLEGEAIQQYGIYRRDSISDEWFMLYYYGSEYVNISAATGLGNYIIRDVTQDKWYRVLDENTFIACLYMRIQLGEWEMIENATP